jgi:hypothetical protein
MSERRLCGFRGRVLGRRTPLCAFITRGESAYAEKDEDSAMYERGRSGAVLGRGDAEVRMAAL